MKKILFIVNPHSERRKGVKLVSLIRDKLDLSRFEYSISYSEYHRHAYELARSAVEDYDIIVAAGGDGTVNQVSEALSGTDTPMGILPIGSGNGLAYGLGIPARLSSSLSMINRLNMRKIDCAGIGGRHFVNMAGIGFDAEIAHDFEGRSKRGLGGYVLSVFMRFFAYKPQSCTLRFEDQVHELCPFIMSFANTGQYGNNAYIAPDASPEDGMLDISVLSKFPLCAAPILAARLFLRNIHRSKYYRIYRVEKAMVTGSDKFKGHIDGEAVVFGKSFDIVAQPKSLEIIV